MSTAAERLSKDLVVSVDAIQRYLDSKGHTWDQLESGTTGYSLEQAQEWLLQSDPVVWAEANLVERNTASARGRCWKFWDYQAASLRYRGHTIHECGAEVGKTREIVALCLFSLFSHDPEQAGDQLIGAAQDGHLEEIWDEIDFQIHANPSLHAQVDHEATKRKPYKKLVAKNGSRVLFRPAGTDGAAFRGVHVPRRAFLDEAAKIKNPKCFDEFFRAAMPGCEIRIYSTPDGDRACRFFELCTETPAVDPLAPRPPDTSGRSRVFIRIRWPKELMPEPFWSEDRRRDFVAQYGGEDSPGYQQNVKGNWGDPSASVFPWHHLEKVLTCVDDYVAAKLLWSESDGELAVTAYRLNRAYSVTGPSGDEDETSVAAGPTQTFFEQRYDLGNLDVGEILRRIFSPFIGAHLVVGIDCGGSDDPTEALAFQHLGDGRLRLVARLHLKRWPYPRQQEAVFAFDRLLGEPDYGVGMDSGGVGAALEGYLREGLPEHRDLGAELSGYIFNSKIPELDPATGEPVTDREGRERKVTLKEYSTRLLELAIQEARCQLPFDPDIVRQFPNHQAKRGKGADRIFDNTNDHLIDASRCAALRFEEIERGGFTSREIEFAVSGKVRSAAVRGLFG